MINKIAEIKTCAYCGMNMIEGIHPVPFESVDLVKRGKNVYLSILSGNFKSIDLCGFDYTCMQGYRHSLPKMERWELESESQKELSLNIETGCGGIGRH